MKRLFFVLVGSSLVATFLGATEVLAYVYPPGSPLYQERREEMQAQREYERQIEALFDEDSAHASATVAASTIDAGQFDRSDAAHAGAPGGKGKGPLPPTGFGTWMLALLTAGIGIGWYNERLRRVVLGA